MSQNSLPHDLDAIQLKLLMNELVIFVLQELFCSLFLPLQFITWVYYFNLGEKKTVKNNNTLDNIEINVSHLMKVSPLRKKGMMKFINYNVSFLKSS